jgi:hypothetical protein
MYKTGAHIMLSLLIMSLLILKPLLADDAKCYPPGALKVITTAKDRLKDQLHQRIAFSDEGFSWKRAEEEIENTISPLISHYPDCYSTYLRNYTLYSVSLKYSFTEVTEGFYPEFHADIGHIWLGFPAEMTAKLECSLADEPCDAKMIQGELETLQKEIFSNNP